MESSTLFLFLIPVTNEVANIKAIGTRFIKNKNRSFLSLKFNLNLNFLSKEKLKRKKELIFQFV